MSLLTSKINSRRDLENLLADAPSRDAALVYLQAIMDERYNYRPDGSWGVVEPNGLPRLGLTAAEAVEMGVVDRAVPEPARVGPTLAEAQAAKITEATAVCDAVLAPLGVEYGRWETATWDQQYDEAVALMADPAVVVPLLASLAGARGMDVGVLAQRVLRNRETWSVLTGNVIGQRLAIVDRINAATTVAEVMAVEVAISLPG